ncbi:Uncharacterized integral membrane protein (DUF2301), partial [Musa troglodytarum]
MAMAAIMASVPLSSSALLAPTSLPPPKRSSLPRNSCSIAPHLVSSSSSSCSRKLSSYSASTSYLSSGQIGSVRCRATGEGSPPTFDDRLVYQGVYGPWTLPGPNDQVQPVPTQEKLKQLIPVLWKQYWFSAELVRTNQYHCRKRRKEEEGGKGRKKRRKKKVEDEGGK